MSSFRSGSVLNMGAMTPPPGSRRSASSPPSRRARGEVYAEMQAVVIVCGDDALMYPLTATPNLPKSLLPVGTVPLLWFQLALLQRAGFERVVLAVEKPFRDPIMRSLTMFRERSGHTMDVKCETVEEQIGSADVLRSLAHLNLITSDFVVLTGDTIISDVIERLADVHHLSSASFTMVLQDTKARRKGIDGVNYMALSTDDQRVLKLANDADLEGETITLPKALLRRRPDILISTELVDMRTYIFSRWVIDYIVEEKELSGITEDLVPALVNMQFRTGSRILSESIRSKIGLDESIQVPRSRMASARSVFADDENVNIASAASIDKMSDVRVSQDGASAASDVDEAANARDDSSIQNENGHGSGSFVVNSGISMGVEDDGIVRCHYLLVDSDKEYMCRAGTPDEYVAMNTKIMKGADAAAVQNLPYPPGTEVLINSVSKSRRKRGNIEGEACDKGKGLKMKHTVLGDHCRIGDKVKLERCIIMNHVAIGAGSVLKDCVIGANCNIGKNCTIEKTRAGPGTTFEDGEKCSNEEIGQSF